MPDPAEAAKKRRNVKAQLDAMRGTLEFATKALSNEAVDKLRLLKNSSVANRKAATEGANALGAVAKLSGIGGDTWRRMWEAAREYSTSSAYTDRTFPQVENEARCVLCHQELSLEARQRMIEFESFVRGKLETDAQIAEDAFTLAIKDVPSRPTEMAILTACTASELSDKLAYAVETGWRNLELLLAPLRIGTIPDDAPAIDGSVAELLSELDSLSIAAEATAKVFDMDVKNGDRLKARKELAESEAKKWVTEQASAVRAEVERLTRLEEYHQWKRKTVTTGVSRKSGELWKS